MRAEAIARAVSLLAFAAWCAPLDAAILYKSVSPSGVIEFSDVPPDRNTILERIPVKRDDEPSAPSDATGFDLPPPRNGPASRTADAMIDKANAQLDLAEHALALARQGRWSDEDPTHLATPRMTKTDLARVEFYRKGVHDARQGLMQALAMKRKAEPETYTALNTSPLLR
jgi:hypothetical protein